MHRSRLLIVVAAMIVLAACQSDSSDPRDDVAAPGGSTPVAQSDQPANVSTLTPYPVPTPSDVDAPSGFEPVFAQFVARHGARSLTGGEPLEDVIALWEEAEQADALTETGRRFGPDARALYTAMKEVGFGELNTLGAEEMRGIGKREGKRLATLFEDAPGEGAKVEMVHSGKSRAEDSARMFGKGLGSVHPELAIEPPEENENLLKFDNENDEYEDFLDGDAWKPDYYKVRRLSKIDAAAVDALEHLFTPSFVAGIDEPLYYGNAVFDVYRAGPSMSRDVNVDTTRLMPKDAAAAYAYVEDARFFYRRGPGVEGDDSTYQAAQILLDDFFEVIDDRLEGRGSHPHAAVYRFAHAEEITPFAAMLELPGSDEQGKPGEAFTLENNDFRVSTVAPLSANIGWTVWQKNDTNIVSVRYNEVPTTIGRDCQPYEGTKNFYELDELRSCLGATG
ncbi:histidine-type phosphatase [Aeromicrobium sp.]|uniref:histidine-type phosphatase n=1 Tax=Aeromicrobium sp. TaxID=1871063 RepID=UPI003D6C1F8F